MDSRSPGPHQLRRDTLAMMIDFDDRDPTPTKLGTKIAFTLLLIVAVAGMVASYA